MSKFKMGCLTLLSMSSAVFAYYTDLSEFYILTGLCVFFLIAEGD